MRVADGAVDGVQGKPGEGARHSLQRPSGGHPVGSVAHRPAHGVDRILPLGHVAEPDRGQSQDGRGEQPERVVDDPAACLGHAAGVVGCLEVVGNLAEDPDDILHLTDAAAIGLRRFFRRQLPVLVEVVTSLQFGQGTFDGVGVGDHPLVVGPAGDGNVLAGVHRAVVVELAGQFQFARRLGELVVGRESDARRARPRRLLVCSLVEDALGEVPILDQLFVQPLDDSLTRIEPGVGREFFRQRNHQVFQAMDVLGHAVHQPLAHQRLLGALHVRLQSHRAVDASSVHDVLQQRRDASVPELHQRIRRVQSQDGGGRELANRRTGRSNRRRSAGRTQRRRAGVGVDDLGDEVLRLAIQIPGHALVTNVGTWANQCAARRSIDAHALGDVGFRDAPPESFFVGPLTGEQFHVRLRHRPARHRQHESFFDRRTKHAPPVGHLVEVRAIRLHVHAHVRVRFERRTEFVGQVPELVPDRLRGEEVIDEVSQLGAHVRADDTSNHLGHEVVLTEQSQLAQLPGEPRNLPAFSLGVERRFQEGAVDHPLQRIP